MGDRVLYNTLFNFREYTELVNLLLVKYYFIIDFFIKENKIRFFAQTLKLKFHIQKNKLFLRYLEEKKPM
jgi:hypothetical protein